MRYADIIEGNQARLEAFARHVQAAVEANMEYRETKLVITTSREALSDEEETSRRLDGPDTAEMQSQMAYRIIEEMIVTLRIAPGSRISEKSLNKTLGIGRTPIREALQRLALEGTVKILPRAGVIVSE